MQLKRCGLALGAVLVFVGAAFGLRSFASAASPQEPAPTLTAGTMPSTAFSPNGSINPDQVPDLISVTDHGGQIVGYAYAVDIIPSTDPLPPERQPDGIIEVFDHTGARLVGHLYPDGAGFYSLEQEVDLGYSPKNPPPKSTERAPDG